MRWPEITFSSSLGSCDARRKRKVDGRSVPTAPSPRLYSSRSLSIYPHRFSSAPQGGQGGRGGKRGGCVARGLGGGRTSCSQFHSPLLELSLIRSDDAVCGLQGGILGWVEEQIVRVALHLRASRFHVADTSARLSSQCTVPTARTNIHFFALQVSSLEAEWPEQERQREWVSPEDALVRVGESSPCSIDFVSKSELTCLCFR